MSRSLFAFLGRFRRDPGISVAAFAAALACCLLLSDFHNALLGLAGTLVSVGVARLAVLQRRFAARSRALEQALAHMSQGLVMIDREGQMIVANKRAGEMLGLPAEFLEAPVPYAEVTRFQLGISDANYADPHFQDLVRSVAKSVDFGTHERTRPDGTVLEVHSVPLGEGSFLRTYLDVTERKKAVVELAKAKNHAEADGRAKEAFFAMMSHEMRTPLNGVIGLADVLADSDLGPVERGHVRTLQDSANDLLKIINDLLDFSKMRSDGFALEHAGFDLERVVTGAIATVTTLAQAKGLDIHADIDPILASRLVGDGARLKQVLLNLLGNAVKFTDTGSIRLTVSSEGRDANFDRIRFAVQDTGVGIPAASKPTLFDAFTQVDTSISRRLGGTGLGLAISQKIVEAMGSRIDVDSEPGHGSTFAFSVTFPIDASAAADATSSPIAIAGKMRILLTEDNETNILVATTLLRKMGHSVDIARNGMEAVNAAAERRYDLILMDMMMPVMDGLSAARAIRNQPAGKCTDIPILALTANTLPGQIEEIAAAGMDASVSKPITRDSLALAISRAAGGPGALSLRARPAAPARDRLPVVDRQVLDDLTAEVGEDGAAAMIEVFMRDATRTIIELRDAAADIDRIERAAHSIKSSSAIFGFARLSRLAAEIERSARGKDSPADPAGYLEAALNETRRLIKAA